MMAKYVAWVDGKECLDSECQAVGNSTWDARVIYCSTQCFEDDGHKHTPMGEDDSHGLIGVYGFVLEPSCCEHCASCEKKVIQGIECEFEHDDECITNMERLLAEAKGGK